MQLKSLRAARVSLGILVMLGTASSIDAIASSEHITTADMKSSRQPAAVATTVYQYEAPAHASRAVYTLPVVEQPPVTENSARVSDDRVDGWKLMVAVIGLIGIRLWHAGKKSLPLIG
ncbi:MAG: hypothetical protein IV085_01310 [Thiobacillus sp.]|nr:hypothetical protein [Thiobacillus sp.]